MQPDEIAQRSERSKHSCVHTQSEPCTHHSTYMYSLKTVKTGSLITAKLQQPGMQCIIKVLIGYR